MYGEPGRDVSLTCRARDGDATREKYTADGNRLAGVFIKMRGEHMRWTSLAFCSLAMILVSAHAAAAATLTHTLAIVSTPEPTSLAILGVGAAALLFRRRKEN